MSHILGHDSSLPDPPFVARIDTHLDKLHCTLLRVLDLQRSLWLTTGQTLACNILYWLRAELYTFSYSRSRLVQLGGSEESDVVDLDGLDGYSEFAGCRYLFHKGEHDSSEICCHRLASIRSLSDVRLLSSIFEAHVTTYSTSLS